MYRGKTQVLYSYLPQKTFDYEDEPYIFMVKDVVSQPIDKENTDILYITNKIIRYILRWDEGNRDFPSNLSLNSFYFGNIQQVQGRLFPLVFECSNVKCKKVHQFYDLHTTKELIRCTKCGSSLEQIDLVAVHECGKIEPILIHKCPVHGDEHIVLERHGSMQIANYEWQCRVTGCNHRSKLFQYCNCKDNPRPRMTIVNHNRSMTYYPHYITMINLKDNSREKKYEDEVTYGKIVMAAYLKLFDYGNQSLLSILSDETERDENIAKMRTLLEAMGFTQEQIEIQIKSTVQQMQNNKAKSKKEKIIEKIDQLIDIDNERIKDICDELYEYIRISTIDNNQDIKIYTLGSLSKTNQDDYFNNYIIECKDIFNLLGLQNVTLIEQLPITYVAFGYSRLSRVPNQAKLNCFPLDANDKYHYPVYMNTTKTEALHFQLDLKKVLKWLEKNEIIDIDVNQLSEQEIKAWFINHMEDIDFFGEITNKETKKGEITYYLFTLLHSFAHLVLKQCTLLSGFDVNTLSEYLFPKTMSFMIYVNNRSSFVIGGLFTVFEQNLHNLLNKLKDEGDYCVYDPICKDEKGACHACMYIAEFSCSAFNKNLDRNYLFGGIDKRSKKQIIGYFEI